MCMCMRILDICTSLWRPPSAKKPLPLSREAPVSGELAQSKPLVLQGVFHPSMGVPFTENHGTPADLREKTIVFLKLVRNNLNVDQRK